MNKVYKTILNALTGETAVTSELVKSRGKTQGEAQCDVSSQIASNAATQSHKTNHAGSFLRRLTITMLFAGLPLFAQAENITYDNEPGKLAPDLWGNSSLFPSTSLTGNTVKVISGTINGSVYGGITDDDQDVSGNQVTILGGQIGESVYGGTSVSGSVMNNSVDISGGRVYGSVFGGADSSGDAIGNSVTISGGKVVNNLPIYGGYSEFGDATGNSVIISGKPLFNSTNTVSLRGILIQWQW